MMMYPFDPSDPTQVFYSPLPDDATPEQIEQYQRLALRLMLRGLLTFVTLLVLMALLSLFCGCTTVRTATTDTTDRRVSDLVQRMDSLFGQRTVTRQDSAWRESVLRQFQSIRERSDTSRTQVVDTAGNVIRERLVINNVRETSSETDRLEREVMIHRLEVMDSTLHVMQQQLSHSDSLLHERQEVREREVPARLSWFQQMQLWLGRLVMVALAACAAVWLLRRYVRSRLKLPWGKN